MICNKSYTRSIKSTLSANLVERFPTFWIHPSRTKSQQVYASVPRRLEDLIQILETECKRHDIKSAVVAGESMTFDWVLNKADNISGLAKRLDASDSISSVLQLALDADAEARECYKLVSSLFLLHTSDQHQHQGPNFRTINSNSHLFFKSELPHINSGKSISVKKLRMSCVKDMRNLSAAFKGKLRAVLESLCPETDISLLRELSMMLEDLILDKESLNPGVRYKSRFDTVLNMAIARALHFVSHPEIPPELWADTADLPAWIIDMDSQHASSGLCSVEEVGSWLLLLRLTTESFGYKYQDFLQTTAEISERSASDNESSVSAAISLILKEECHLEQISGETLEAVLHAALSIAIWLGKQELGLLAITRLPELSDPLQSGNSLFSEELAAACIAFFKQNMYSKSETVHTSFLDFLSLSAVRSLVCVTNSENSHNSVKSQLSQISSSIIMFSILHSRNTSVERFVTAQHLLQTSESLDLDLHAETYNLIIGESAGNGIEWLAIRAFLGFVNTLAGTQRMRSSFKNAHPSMKSSAVTTSSAVPPIQRGLLKVIRHLDASTFIPQLLQKCPDVHHHSVLLWLLSASAAAPSRQWASKSLEALNVRSSSSRAHENTAEPSRSPTAPPSELSNTTVQYSCPLMPPAIVSDLAVAFLPKVSSGNGSPTPDDVETVPADLLDVETVPADLLDVETVPADLLHVETVPHPQQIDKSSSEGRDAAILAFHLMLEGSFHVQIRYIGSTADQNEAGNPAADTRLLNRLLGYELRTDETTAANSRTMKKKHLWKPISTKCEPSFRNSSLGSTAELTTKTTTKLLLSLSEDARERIAQALVMSSESFLTLMGQPLALELCPSQRMASLLLQKYNMALDDRGGTSREQLPAGFLRSLVVKCASESWRGLGAAAIDIWRKLVNSAHISGSETTATLVNELRDGGALAIVRLALLDMEATVESFDATLGLLLELLRQCCAAFTDSPTVAPEHTSSHKSITCNDYKKPLIIPSITHHQDMRDWHVNPEFLHEGKATHIHLLTHKDWRSVAELAIEAYHSTLTSSSSGTAAVATDSSRSYMSTLKDLLDLCLHQALSLLEAGRDDEHADVSLLDMESFQGGKSLTLPVLFVNEALWLAEKSLGTTTRGKFGQHRSPHMPTQLAEHLLHELKSRSWLLYHNSHHSSCNRHHTFPPQPYYDVELATDYQQVTSLIQTRYSQFISLWCSAEQPITRYTEKADSASYSTDSLQVAKHTQAGSANIPLISSKLVSNNSRVLQLLADLCLALSKSSKAIGSDDDNDNDDDDKFVRVLGEVSGGVPAPEISSSTQSVGLNWIHGLPRVSNQEQHHRCLVFITQICLEEGHMDPVKDVLQFCAELVEKCEKAPQEVASLTIEVLTSNGSECSIREERMLLEMGGLCLTILGLGESFWERKDVDLEFIQSKLASLSNVDQAAVMHITEAICLNYQWSSMASARALLLISELQTSAKDITQDAFTLSMEVRLAAAEAASSYQFESMKQREPGGWQARASAASKRKSFNLQLDPQYHSTRALEVFQALLLQASSDPQLKAMQPSCDTPPKLPLLPTGHTYSLLMAIHDAAGQPVEAIQVAMSLLTGALPVVFTDVVESSTDVASEHQGYQGRALPLVTMEREGCGPDLSHPHVLKCFEAEKLSSTAVPERHMESVMKLVSEAMAIANASRLHAATLFLFLQLLGICEAVKCDTALAQQLREALSVNFEDGTTFSASEEQYKRGLAAVEEAIGEDGIYEVLLHEDVAPSLLAAADDAMLVKALDSWKVTVSLGHSGEIQKTNQQSSWADELKLLRSVWMQVWMQVEDTHIASIEFFPRHNGGPDGGRLGNIAVGTGNTVVVTDPKIDMCVGDDQTSADPTSKKYTVAYFGGMNFKDSDRRMVLANSPPETELRWYGSSREVGSGQEAKLIQAIKSQSFDKVYIQIRHNGHVGVGKVIKVCQLNNVAYERVAVGLKPVMKARAT
ncbi:hypothetical protein CEUSTIGMA_g3721.t1 [Chlamydomonas eustigma]|uniref:Uncharacterized protein n=1 Tax=Chlamydomonas eustigma TaxID=1157962 RepID=A0A250WZL3_9CHLO|nr:hypothetical protein CEUSTIGMA_g3721.t1 [Chlamydomonas eustigma]|eukprot:GAX76277.1 hypothetical protein CEUSTIGMA_g3721.t1 [Chlamydomonas eustigma]